MPVKHAVMLSFPGSLAPPLERPLWEDYPLVLRLVLMRLLYN